MKLSFIVCASILVVAAFAVDGAFAKNISDGAAKGQANEGTAQPTSCPTGQSWDSATKKCVATSDVNYNSSKSNSGNSVATAPATETTNVHKPTDTSSTPPK